MQAAVADDEFDGVAPDVTQRLNRRLKIPGASSSHQEFMTMFRRYTDITRRVMTSERPHGSLAEATSILERTAAWRNEVATEKPHFSEDLMLLAVGALAIYRMRLVDMFLREHALLLVIHTHAIGQRVYIPQGILLMTSLMPYRLQGIPHTARRRSYLLQRIVIMTSFISYFLQTNLLH